jgi:hypothetical protein
MLHKKYILTEYIAPSLGHAALRTELIVQRKFNVFIHYLNKKRLMYDFISF